MSARPGKPAREASSASPLPPASSRGGLATVLKTTHNIRKTVVGAVPGGF